ncbi:hypothetical protein [Amycolatopsis sp. NPDC006125]|uniref:hypothetical protein n=1 Tax=Amycolatopsis sp. NPDC006125 TaxID=3156730 RepID=UPI0033BDDD36
MPRRRPAQLRTGRTTWPEHRRIPQVGGVSAGTLRAIAHLERTRLHPGAVAEAVAGWSRFVHGPARRFDGYAPEDCPCPGCQWDDPVVRRKTVAAVLAALPRRAARELRCVLCPLDEPYLARAVADPETYRVRVLLL